VHYILITDEMKNTIWKHKNKGLLFLVYHSSSFSRIYESAGIEIFEYLG